MATPSQLSDKLRLAASKGEKGKIKDLLQDGALFDIDKYGRTALHYAAYYGQADTAKACVQLGCDINIQDVYGSTALHRSVIDGHVDVVQALIEEGIAVDRQDENGNTALHEAAWNGYSRTVDMLIKFGKCNIHAANKHGMRAIHLSCQNGHNQTTRNLLRSGTHPSIKDSHGDTPLHVATRFGHVACTRIIVSGQSDINAQNKDGNTSLHMAAGLGKQKIARILTDSGCDVNIRNNNNFTAIDLARKNEHPDLILIIMSAPKRKYQEKEKAKRKDKHSKSLGAIGGEASPATRVKKEVRFKHHRNKSDGAENPASPGKKRKELKNVDQIDSILVAPKDKASKKKHKDKDKKKEEEKRLHESAFVKHELKKRVKEQKKIQEGIMMAHIMNQPAPSQHIYYTDKKKSLNSSVGCNCTPHLLEIQNQVDANREVMIYEIEHSHNKLDRKIGSLEKKMEHQGECLDKLCKERVHAEHTECLHRLDRRAMLERADWEETHVDRMGNVKEELKEWVVQELQTDDIDSSTRYTNNSLCKTDDSGYVQTRSNMNSLHQREGTLSPFPHDHNQNRTAQHIDNFRYSDSHKSSGISSPEPNRSQKSAPNRTLIVEDVLPADKSSKNTTNIEPNHKDYVHIGRNVKRGAHDSQRFADESRNRESKQDSGDMRTSLYVHTGAVPKTRSNSFTKAVLKQGKIDKIKKHQQTVQIEVHKEFIDGEKTDNPVMGHRSGDVTVQHGSPGSLASPNNNHMSSQNSYQRSRSLSPKREPDVSNPSIINSRSNLEINKDDNLRSRSISPAYQKVQATSRDRKSRQAARKSDMINEPDHVTVRTTKSLSPSRRVMVNGFSPDSGLESNRHHSLTEDDQMSMSSGIGSAGQSSPQQTVNLKSLPNGHSVVTPNLRTEKRGNAPLFSKSSSPVNQDYANNHQHKNAKAQNDAVLGPKGTTKRLYIDTSQYDLQGKGKLNPTIPIEHSKEPNINQRINDSHVLRDQPRSASASIAQSLNCTSRNSTDPYHNRQSPSDHLKSNYSHTVSTPHQMTSNIPNRIASIGVKGHAPTSDTSSTTFHPRIVNVSGQPLVVTNMNGKVYSRNALPTQQAPPRNVSDSEQPHMIKSCSFQSDTERRRIVPPYHNSSNSMKPAQHSSQPDLHVKRQESKPIPHFTATSNTQHSGPSHNSSYEQYQQPQQQVPSYQDRHTTPSSDKLLPNELYYQMNNSPAAHSPPLSVSSASTTLSGGSGNRRRNPLDASLMQEFLSSATESKHGRAGPVTRDGESNPSKVNTLSKTVNTSRKTASNLSPSAQCTFSTFGY